MAAVPLHAAVLNVPTQFATIQAAIDAAQSGDEIVLGPGEYLESLVIAEKNLVLRGNSQTPASVTIRPGLTQTVLTVEGGSNVQLIGVALRGGTGATRTACGGVGEYAGGVFIDGSTVELQRCELTDHNGEIGGAVFVIGGRFVARQTLFANNGTAPAGVSSVGAVLRTCDRSAPSQIVLEDSHLVGNGNPLQPGLDIVSVFNGDLTVTRTTFGNNFGSALRPFGIVQLEVSDSDFMGNRSVGGAISLFALSAGSAASIRATEFTSNQGDAAADVAAALPGGVRLVISACTFTSSDGGSTFFTMLPDDEVLVDRSQFRDVGGPAVAFNNDGGRLTVRSVLMAGTQSDAILANSSGAPGPLNITNCTIAGSAGRGIRTDAFLFGTLTITNSIVVNNAGGQIGVPLLPGAVIQVSSSIVQGGFAGTGNLNVAPGFADAPAGDYRLSASSPAIDAGDTSIVIGDFFGAPEFDAAGRPRRSDAPLVTDTGVGPAPVVDIGAYEFTSPAACPADQNRDGAVSVQDIFDFLFAYFNTLPAADFNASGSVTVQDIFDFLFAYFRGC